MKKTASISLLLFILLILFIGFKEESPFEKFLRKIEEFNQKRHYEKVHLHLDKPYYAVGDDIWFKAYVVDSYTNSPSQISGALQIELINEKSNFTKKLKIPLNYGLGWGDFKLSDSLPEGNYRIRAYTNWMRNDGQEFFYDKVVKIGNAWSNNVFTNTSYRFVTENNIRVVYSKIKFTDKNALPYRANVVTYEVRLNNLSTAKGKATTDNNGEIEIKFTAGAKNFNTGEIIANIALTGNQSASKHILINQTSNQVDVQFFPEGGNLLENIPTKIAFKATNNNGLGENITATIKDSDGTLLTESKAQHLGMGSFILNPQSGHTYHALVKFSDGSEKTFPIGAALPKGYALAVNNTDSAKISIKAFISEGLVGKGNLKLIAQHNNKVIFSTQFSASKQLISATIPKIKLPSGILKITLLAENNQPVCERLLFIKGSSDKLDIDLMQATKGKDNRDKKTFKASLNGKPVSGSFSVSINNISKIKPDELNESNIFTDLLLTSDLAGYVEKPNYYFLAENKETTDNLDLLLLTQGWRRFIWKDFLQTETTPITFLPEKFLQISGTVTTRTLKPAEKIKIQLFSSSKANGIISLDTLTDNQGRFNFDKLTFNDSTRFIIKADAEKDQKSLKITLDTNPYQAITINKNGADFEINVNGSMLPYLQHNQNYIKELTRLGVLKSTVSLETVNITATRKTIAESSNYNGPGVADVVITEEDLVTAFDLPKWIEGRVMGVTIDDKDKMAYLTRSSVLDGMASPMLLIIDGAQVEPTILQEIPPQDVKSIEILKNAALTAAYGVDKGVIIITTKKGTGSTYKNQIMPGIASHSPMGYYVAKEFYSPKYNLVQKDAVDFRTTIFWSPNIISDKEGIASFEYELPKEKGNYRVVIEGIDAFGNLARKVYTDKID